MSDAPVLVRSGQADIPELPGTLRMLTRLIQREPDMPVHYVLRGEEWLVYGQLAPAQADFEAARRLAASEAETSAWGYLYQAYVDRADAGLRRCGAIDD